MSHKISKYHGKTAALATMHNKQEAMREPFSRILGISLATASSLDTDILGTFTGEVPRKGSIKDTVLTKARMGMNALHLDLGFASEGSYGLHPYFPMIPGGIEIMVFVDDEIGMILFEHLIVGETNFSHVVVNSAKGLADFLKIAGFPEHGIIVSPNLKRSNEGKIFKGIHSASELNRAIKISAEHSADGMAFVHTDMRANQNPTRMMALSQLSEKFARRLLELCPECKAPGFGFVDQELGLECEVCGSATDLVKNEIYGCAVCSYRESRASKNHQEKAPPSNCLVCNP